MYPDQIYALTPLGMNQLHSSATRLNPAEIDVLLRVHGVLTLAQILNAVTPEARR